MSAVGAAEDSVRAATNSIMDSQATDISTSEVDSVPTGILSTEVTVEPLPKESVEIVEVVSRSDSTDAAEKIEIDNVLPMQMLEGKKPMVPPKPPHLTWGRAMSIQDEISSEEVQTENTFSPRRQSFPAKGLNGLGTGLRNRVDSKSAASIRLVESDPEKEDVFGYTQSKWKKLMNFAWLRDRPRIT